MIKRFHYTEENRTKTFSDAREAKAASPDDTVIVSSLTSNEGYEVYVDANGVQRLKRL
jgi:hypothetical protein